MSPFRILLCVAWLTALVAGVHAYLTQGMVAGQIFGGDIRPRGQFDIYFFGHLIVLALGMHGTANLASAVLRWAHWGDMRHFLLWRHRA